MGNPGSVIIVATSKRHLTLRGKTRRRGFVESDEGAAPLNTYLASCATICQKMSIGLQAGDCPDNFA